MSKYSIHNEGSQQEVLKAVDALSLKKPWTVEIKRKTDKRTLNQNRLYHQWLGIIAQELGNDHDDQGQIMMKHLIGPTHYVKNLQGDEDPAWSTTKMDVPTMSAYMDSLSRWAASNNIRLPHPDDQHRRY